MKIEGRNGVAPERVPARREGDVERTRGAPAGSGEAVRVDLSPTARRLPDLVREVGDVRAMDSARVAELRARIASGEYAPDDEAVAAALLREIAADEEGRSR